MLYPAELPARESIIPIQEALGAGFASAFRPINDLRDLLFSYPRLETVDCQLPLALHWSDGNSAAAYALDGKTGADDEHRYWKHRTELFAEISRW